MPIPQVRVGCSGWSYDDWRGPFYPPGTPPGDYLERYARVFDIVEVDSTYYHLPRREQVERWASVTPDGFTFVPKMWSRITHEAALRDVAALLERYLAQLEPLARAGKLGPILVQLPASFVPERDAHALDGFVRALPRDLQWAVELRNKKWWTRATFDLLRDANVGLVWSVNQYADVPPEETADFLVGRFIGDRELTRFDRIQRDLTPHVHEFKTRLEKTQRARTAYLFANNHFMGYGPGTARLVQEVLGLPQAELALASRSTTAQRGLLEFGGAP